MRENGIPESYIYAYYQTDGLTPCSLNEDIMPETDKEEFAEYEKEYRTLMEDPMEDSLHAIQFVSLVNELLANRLGVQEMIIDSLNDFIHRHKEELWQTGDYSVETELDYLLFSALKTVKTLTGIRTLSGYPLTECVLSLGRSLFENYLYLSKLNCDDTFFRNKLLPKADTRNYRFVRQDNGKTSYTTVQNIHTGERFHIHVKISDLKQCLQEQEDMDLYELFYSDSCQYVHVDISTAQNYFYSFDPYDEVNPSLCAATVTSAIALLVFHGLTKNQHVQPQFQKDAQYLTRKIAGILAPCFEILSSDPEHCKPIYGVLALRMKKLAE